MKATAKLPSAPETPAAKANSSSPPDRLQSFGQSLYGEHWLKPMSRDLKIRPDTVAKWMSGKRQADQVIFEALAILFAYHKKAVVKASEILDRNRKKAD